MAVLESRRLLSGAANEITLVMSNDVGVHTATIQLPAEAVGTFEIATSPTGGSAVFSAADPSHLIYTSSGTASMDAFEVTYQTASGGVESLNVAVHSYGTPMPGPGPMRPNMPPIAVDASGFVVLKDEIGYGDLRPFATDPDGDTLSFSSDAPEITMNFNGEFFFDPPVGVVGRQTYSYMVSDRHGHTVTKSLHIDIQKPTVSIWSENSFFSEVIAGTVNVGVIDQGELTVTRTGGLKSPLSVILSYDGNARRHTPIGTTSADYIAPTTVTFPAGVRSVVVPLESLNDMEVEGAKLVIGIVEPSDDYLIGVVQATSTLIDNDAWRWKKIDASNTSGLKSDSKSAPNTQFLMPEGVVMGNLWWDTTIPGKITAGMSGTSAMPKTRLVPSLIPPSELTAMPVYSISWESYIDYQNISGNLDYQFSFNPKTGLIIGQDGGASGATNDGNLSGGLGGATRSMVIPSQ